MRLLLVAVALSGATSGPVAKPPEWAEIDRWVEDQKVESASHGAEARLAAAKASGDADEWTRALAKVTQLRIALEGYETAVRFLRTETWPKSPPHRAVLDLVYAGALETYAQAYSWELRQREHVDSKEVVDLKSWTSDEVHAEAQRAFEEAWRDREALGSVPVSRFASVLEPGNYPPGIRDTLRDVVSHLRVESLQDSSDWRPEHANGLYRLDLAALVKGDAASSSRVKLDDASVPPLTRASAILDDLDAWHSGRGEREAALEARLARVELLARLFTEPAQRAVIRKDLEARLPAFRDVAWYSAGAAKLAELLRDGGDFVAALRVAGEGKAAFPKSIGGQRCASIAQGIEAPDFQVSAMTADGPGRRSIEVTHKNLAELYFRSYPVDLEKWIAQTREYGVLPSAVEISRLMSSAKPERSWTEKLPATPDFQSHRTFVTPPVTSAGLHVVVVSARKDFGAAGNRLLAVRLILGDLVLLTRTDVDGGLEASVVSGGTGKPLAGAEVMLYRADYRSGFSVAERRRTDGQGVAAFKFDEKKRGNSFYVLAKLGAQVTLDARGRALFRQAEPGPADAALVFTDRSVYRPMQKVLWKVIAYRGDAAAARYQTQPGADVTVTLTDPNGQAVATQKVRTNGFGSAAGEFVVPSGRPLGSWRLGTTPSGGASVRVEEYKRPTFEVSLRAPEAALRINRPATLVGEARYYFGLPLSRGAARWKVVRSPHFPRWWDWLWTGPASRTETVAGGTSEIQPDGTFRVAFTPEADEANVDRGVTYRYDISADVTDDGGETRSATRALRLGRVAVEAQVLFEGGFARAGSHTQATLVRSGLDGQPLPGKGQWRLLSLAVPAEVQLPADEPIRVAPEPAGPSETPKFETPGDRLKPRWQTGVSPAATMRGWADGDEVASGNADHDAKGEARVELPVLRPGAYRLRYETADGFGEKCEAANELIVSGPALALPVPLFLSAETDRVEAGGTARLLAHSGLVGQPMVLEVFRGGRRVARRAFTSGKDSALIELPVAAADRGGFTVTLTAVRDFQLMRLEQPFFVPWDDKELQVELGSFRDHFRPGAKETFRVTVKGKGGARPEVAAAELLAYMYDRSLDAFLPHLPDSVARLYSRRGGAGWMGSSLVQSWAEWLEAADFVEPLPYPGLQGPRLKEGPANAFGGLGMRGKWRGGGGRMAFRALGLQQAERMKDGSPEGGPGAGVPPPPPEEKATAGEPGRAGGSPAPQPAPAVELRSDFSETGFWKPQLLTGPDGSASVEFTAPDSVTSWSVWVHAVTRDLRGGSATKQVSSVKELMVRPYLPRFLREGDQAAVRVVVDNASTAKLTGALRFEILDPDTQKSLLADFASAATGPVAFSADPGTGATLTFPLVAPRRVGTVAFRVTATAGGLSDGELRPLPVLPSRVRLAQSRFAALHDADKRTLGFDDLAAGRDPSRVNEQLVVTVDGQLFETVLQALPYLIDYPYECTEQTLNRFLSTGIVGGVFKKYPLVARMAEEASRRDTPLETFDAVDPNRKMLLEETPWLQEAQGGKDPSLALVKVLDPKVASAERDASLAKLRRIQTANGGFPWWPGGPPSPYMTLYVVQGFSRAAELGVDVPKDLVQRAWQYLGRQYRDEYAPKAGKSPCCLEVVTFFNYVASSFPDASWTGQALSAEDRRQMLEQSYAHWRELPALSRAQLALTLHRAGRKADAQAVFASVMDSAKTTRDEGTFWAPEDSAWLWYRDTLETHAFALRALTELAPADPRRDGLVQWLMLNKKLNQWKSTRATAEVIYALVKVLSAEGTLGTREETTVTIGPRKSTLVFAPDVYSGKSNHVVVSGAELDPKAMSRVAVEKAGRGLQFASATWHFSTEQLPAEARGDLFSVARRYFKRTSDGKGTALTPLAEGARLAPGDEVEVRLSVRANHPAEYVHLFDPRAVGLEPESALSRYRWNLGVGWYEEVRDSGTHFFFEALPAGEVTLGYRLRANLAGTFRVGPATVQSMYAPEFNAYSAGQQVTVGAAGR